LVWFLFLLGAVVVVGLFIWDYRKKTARREAASKERFEQIFKSRSGAATPETVPGAVAVSPAAAPARPAEVTSSPGFTLKERFLGPPQTLVYLLLKAALPDHGVFPSVALASIVSVTGKGMNHDQQGRLSMSLLDFVVCDRDMHVVAVIELEVMSGGEAPGMERYKVDCLRAAGVRRIALNPKSLPARDVLRNRVLGGADGPR
jgi:hypothetical protein